MDSTHVSAGDEAHSRRLDALDEALLAIHRVFQRPGYRRRLLADLSHELELATLRLLRAVQRDAEAPSIGAMAEALTIDPSTASRLVDRAVETGWLARRACEADRRSTRLYLTPAGEDMLNEVTARRRQLLADVTRGWSADDLERLVELLSRLEDDFDELEGSA